MTKLSWWCCFKAKVKAKVCRRVGGPILWTVPSLGPPDPVDLTSSNRNASGAPSGSDTVWRRKTDGKPRVPVLFFPSFDLSCYYHLSPAIRCSAVTASQETRRQTRGSCWAPPPPQVTQAGDDKGWREGGGVDDSQLRGERGGEVGEVSGGERNGGRWRKTGRAVTKLWLIATVLDIEPRWEAPS